MSGTAKRAKLYDSYTAPVLALLLDRRLIDSWPLELTKRGWSMLHSAPEVNVYRRALLGDPSGITVNNGAKHEGHLSDLPAELQRHLPADVLPASEVRDLAGGG